ncbi:tagaturonate reductase [Geosporobacter ferrireducens]|uniref:Altronate oxidoreductase n=1 Tax=Geosporobacter ferrireducens TaxID=1424294 RepID=A0A1D8GCD3_9FIRM|nr:tagaturonate reductase [Geosporobacter ferrireducens]AOT68573.1 altronate oxidoreductase [Geosporobacter ferrireducens]MTI54041.1 tagaturonate reductase [Geosporobacter ferrireducens]
MKKIQETHEKKRYPEKILQIGEGNFLRAFVDWMVFKINHEAGFNGSVVVVQPLKEGMVEKLEEQNGLYTLYLNGIKNGEVVSEHSIIDVISRTINPYVQFDEYLQTAKNPELRFVVSNTTEAGISFDENDKLEDRPQNSFPAKLTAFLYQRYKAFNGDQTKGLIFIPCELIDKNGVKLKEIILKYAKLWNLEDSFINWIHAANTFCNSLVDRIVPGYPKEKIEEIRKELRYEDNMVVEAEPFHLWVIEGPQWVKDEFPADQAGLDVLFVEDLTPYRTRKVRILNGAHTSMVPVAYLYGKDTVREAIEDPVVGKFVKDTIFEEIIPTLELSKEELVNFAGAVIDRFKNPFIKHYLMSISLNAMSKFKTRVLPSILQYKESKNLLPSRLVFSLAALIGFYRGDRAGTAIELKDDAEILELYKNLWSAYDGSRLGLEKLVEQVLAYEKVWEMDLNEVDGLQKQVTDYLALIMEKGMEEAVKDFVR